MRSVDAMFLALASLGASFSVQAQEDNSLLGPYRSCMVPYVTGNPYVSSVSNTTTFIVPVSLLNGCAAYLQADITATLLDDSRTGYDSVSVATATKLDISAGGSVPVDLRFRVGNSGDSLETIRSSVSGVTFSMVLRPDPVNNPGDWSYSNQTTMFSAAQLKSLSSMAVGGASADTTSSLGTSSSSSPPVVFNPFSSVTGGVRLGH